jgi:fructoselysine-6-P-deglycase FrlB-like protein
MPEMTFDPTINAGNLIVVGLALIGLIASWYKFGGRLDMLEYRVKAVEDTLKLIAQAIEKLSDNEKQIALLGAHVTAIDGQLSVLSKEVSDLRRGEGFIQSPRRANVDGEYSRP